MLPYQATMVSEGVGLLTPREKRTVQSAVLPLPEQREIGILTSKGNKKKSSRHHILAVLVL
jgi:hypothetical protein